MNHREKLDLSIWNRAEFFREFINMRTSIYDMTVRMDVTDLVHYCDGKPLADAFNNIQKALYEMIFE